MCDRKDATTRVSDDTPLRRRPNTTGMTTASSPPRSDDPRVERTRTAVIEAATSLLMLDGPAAITHANVAAAAGVSRTTVYTHWPTREDLLRATIDSIRDREPVVDDLTGSLDDDLRTVLRPLIADLLDDERAAMIAAMMQRVIHDPEVVAVRNEFLTEFSGVFRRIVDTAIADGELRDDVDADRALASLAGSLLFARFMSPAGLDERWADQVIDDFVASNAPR